jgi:hypothetical protein
LLKLRRDRVCVCGLPAGASGIREDMLVPIDLEKHNLTVVLDRDREVAFRTQEEDIAFFIEVKYCTEAVKDLFNGRCGCAGDLEAGPQVRQGPLAGVAHGYRPLVRNCPLCVAHGAVFPTQVQIGNQTVTWGTPAAPTPVCLTPADMQPNRKGYFPFTYVETNTNPDALIPIGPYYRNQVSVRHARHSRQDGLLLPWCIFGFARSSRNDFPDGTWGLSHAKINMDGVSVAVSEARPELGLLGVRSVEWIGGVPLVPSRVAQRLDLVLDSNQVCVRVRVCV